MSPAEAPSSPSPSLSHRLPLELIAAIFEHDTVDDYRCPTSRLCFVSRALLPVGRRLMHREATFTIFCINEPNEDDPSLPNKVTVHSDEVPFLDSLAREPSLAAHVRRLTINLEHYDTYSDEDYPMFAPILELLRTCSKVTELRIFVEREEKRMAAALARTLLEHKLASQVVELRFPYAGIDTLYFLTTLPRLAHLTLDDARGYVPEGSVFPTSYPFRLSFFKTDSSCHRAVHAIISASLHSLQHLVLRDTLFFDNAAELHKFAALATLTIKFDYYGGTQPERVLQSLSLCTTLRTLHLHKLSDPDGAFLTHLPPWITQLHLDSGKNRLSVHKMLEDAVCPKLQVLCLPMAKWTELERVEMCQAALKTGVELRNVESKKSASPEDLCGEEFYGYGSFW